MSTSKHSDIRILPPRFEGLMESDDPTLLGMIRTPLSLDASKLTGKLRDGIAGARYVLIKKIIFSLGQILISLSDLSLMPLDTARQNERFTEP